MAHPFDDPDRIRHMLEAAENALLLAKGKRRADFQKDYVLQLALSRLVEMIGEAASRVTLESRKQYRAIPWRDIIGTRNRIVHDYYLLNLNVLWEIIRHDLRPLISGLQRILRPKRKSGPKQR